MRYQLLLEAQVLVVPPKVRSLLAFRNFSMLRPVVLPYKMVRRLKLESIVKNILLPGKYIDQIKELDHEPRGRPKTSLF